MDIQVTQDDVHEDATVIHNNIQIQCKIGDELMWRLVNVLIVEESVMFFDVSSALLLLEMPVDETLLPDSKDMCPSNGADFPVHMLFGGPKRKSVRLKTSSPEQQRDLAKDIVEVHYRVLKIAREQRMDGELFPPDTTIKEKAMLLQHRISNPEPEPESEPKPHEDAIKWRENNQAGRQEMSHYEDDHYDNPEVKESHPSGSNIHEYGRVPRQQKDTALKNKTLTRYEAVKRLSGRQDGTFMIRERGDADDKKQFPYALSVVKGQDVHHVRVENTGLGYVLEPYKVGEMVHDTIDHLKVYYQCHYISIRNSSGAQGSVKLLFPL